MGEHGAAGTGHIIRMTVVAEEKRVDEADGYRAWLWRLTAFVESRIDEKTKPAYLDKGRKVPNKGHFHFVSVRAVTYMHAFSRSVGRMVVSDGLFVRGPSAAKFNLRIAPQILRRLL
jgi:hypothetical protein